MCLRLALSRSQKSTQLLPLRLGNPCTSLLYRDAAGHLACCKVMLEA